MGIVINRPTQYGLSELLLQLDMTLSDSQLSSAGEGESATSDDFPVYAGGPVQRDRGFIIHDGATIWQSSLMLSDTLKLTTSMDILEAIAEGMGPERFLVALGYAGWGKGQLESELAENTWLTCPADEKILFSPNDEQKLAEAMKAMGIRAEQLSGQVGHA